jgi:alpha,alpha-trehalose-phosphate synthase [UDP-forming]
MASEQPPAVTEPRARRSVLLDERLLPRRFLVVSNRLPYGLDVEDDRVVYKRGLGGLVTALDPLLQRTGGTWIGWSGNYEPLPERVQLDDHPAGANYHLRPVSLSRQEVEHYYLGYSNKALWPLFHYFQEHCEFNHEHWETYTEINQRFADAVVREYRDGDLIWIQDYHLLLVPQLIRQQLPKARIAFFLHIPFPSSELFSIEPHAGQLVAGLLGADLVGFHVDYYAYNFLDAVSDLTEHRYSRSEKKISMGGHATRLGVFPISIDFDFFAGLARQDAMADKVEAIRNNYRAETIALGVDRLDYSKGIGQRLRAIELMLEQHPDIQGKFTFVQLSAPSRTKVKAYQRMREEVERMVGHINGRFGGKGCIPIDYRYEGYAQEDLVAYYRAADLALVTPLRDGMNLVAKEYVASQVDNSGALVLSRFAGAAQELRDAVLVNPYDPETMADRIYETVVMTEEEKRSRMAKMREVVRRNDIYWWLERFLRAMA